MIMLRRGTPSHLAIAADQGPQTEPVIYLLLSGPGVDWQYLIEEGRWGRKIFLGI